MDSGTPRHRVAIFGSGKVGTAMSLEVGGDVPVVSRGQDCLCDVACVCWPANAIDEFALYHPLGSLGIKVSFCNGAWSVEDGADHAGVCYVRASSLGQRSTGDRKAWRVGRQDVASMLASAGLGVVCSRDKHVEYVWGKCLYLLPLAMASADTGEDAKCAAKTPRYTAWYDIVRLAAVEAVGEAAVAKQEARVRFLVQRSPRGWRPSPTQEELSYFKAKLCVA